MATLCPAQNTNSLEIKHFPRKKNNIVFYMGQTDQQSAHEQSQEARVRCERCEQCQNRAYEYRAQ
jgi:hypothetical protein